ncbi:MAG: hydrogenase maturation nickel metallochaperone HypA [Candidatus Eremiobacteraeota bacterium]|nr:hydrogenase maturation nickel metallochaperone HypA [Candidatus Eremiobacteraeota bacterium]
MHELSITREILDKVLIAAKANNAKSVNKIHIKIGDFTGFVPDCIEFYFDLLAKNTIAENAVLEFERIPLVLYCSECDYKFTPSGFPLSFACPRCNVVRNELISGKELSIEDIEIDT